MPQAIIAWLAAYIGTAAATAVVSAVIATVINVVLMKVEQLFAPSANRGGGNPPPVNVTSRSTIEFRRLIVGKVRCGGALIFYRTSGTSNQYLWYVVAYAGHQCQAVGDAYVDAMNVPAADINGSTGLVSTANFNGKLYIATHLGTSAQTTDPWLSADFASMWDSNHRLRGICYRVFRMERDDKAWANGAPQSISSVVSGALLYDPRKDTTNGGSGSHRANDATTWEYSNNAALAVRWFLSGGSVTNDVSTRLIKYGLRETDSRIDDSYTIAAANICDESISGANAPPGGAELRYACNIELSCGQLRRDILTELLTPMGPGQLVYVHGTWRIYAAAYDSPVHDFDQNDMHGEMEIQDTSSAAERFNAVCGTYIDASQGYVQATSIFRTQSSYETQDGGQRIEKTLPVRGCTSPYQVQRICELVNRGSRYMRTVKFRFRRKGMTVANWETFTFSHSRYGWTDRVFRCISREVEYQDDGGVIAVITAKQDDPAVYTDLVTADYVTGTSITNAIQQDLPDTPLSLTATSIGGQNIRFDWTLAPFWQLNGVSEIFEFTSITPFSSASLVWQGRGTTAVITRDDTTTRYYWVRVRTIGNQASNPYPATNGVAAAAAQVDTPDLADDAATQTVTNFWQGVFPFTIYGLSLTAGGSASNTAVGQNTTIVTSGAPVGVDYTGNGLVIALSAGTTAWNVSVTVFRDGSAIATCPITAFDNVNASWAAGGSGSAVPYLVSFTFVDTPSAGSHTYSVRMSGAVTGGNMTANLVQMNMKIREMKK